MELRPIYSSDIPTECREFAAREERDPNSSKSLHMSALLCAEFYEALQSREGPRKWVRMNHFQKLFFFEFSLEQHRQHPQLEVGCYFRFHFEVSYLLPVEHRPWRWTKTVAGNLQEAVELALDGLQRCECRPEHLIEVVNESA